MSENVHTASVPALPAHMTWEELAALPDELARQIELYEGRVVLMRIGPARHQRFSRRFAHAIEQNAQAAVRKQSDLCWQIDVKTIIFFRRDESGFRTPDFLVYHCQDSSGDDLHAHDVILAGEILSSADAHNTIEAKKAKYASAGITWYWEADLEGDTIAAIRAYALELSANLPESVDPLRARNYILTSAWTPDDGAEFFAEHPFPIRIARDDLAF